MVESNLTLTGFFQNVYCLEKEIRAVSAQQIGITLTALNRWAGADLTLADLSDELANRWIKDQLESLRLSPKTVKRRRGDVLAVWRYAFNHRLCNPPLRIRNVTVPKRIPDAWPLASLAKMVSVAQQIEGYYPNGVKIALFWEAFIRIGYDTALRLGDLLSLPHDVARTGSFRVIQNKTLQEFPRRLKPRTVEVCRSMASPEREIILAWPYRRESLWVHWRDLILTPAGLATGRREGPQKLRRTSASHFARLYGREAASRHLGHTSGTVADNHYLDPTYADGEVLLPPDFD